MNKHENLPALRAVDAFPVTMDGREMVCLTDPADYVEGEFLLSVGAYVLAAGLDGNRTLADLRKAFTEETGADVAEEDARALVAQLDEAGFLESPCFEAIREAVDRAFRENPVRPAWLAGKSYPADPAELRGYLDQCFSQDGGPGGLESAAPASLPPVRCLIAPHIDLARGGAGYAHAYRRLYAGHRPDLVLIFGVAHAGAKHPFVLTRKDFDTPFGRVTTDAAVVERLAAACDWDAFEEEGLHRTEHSIEFQAMMLARLYKNPPKIVSILCGAFSEDPFAESVEGDPALERFWEACRAITGDTQQSVLTLAGADLSHVGRRFGDEVTITDRIEEMVRRADGAALTCLEEGNPEEFYRRIMRRGNPRHVCGMGAIYGAVRAWAGTPPSFTLLHYDYAPDPVDGMVSFAALSAE